LKEPVTFKSIKYNKQFNPLTSSTCPCVPRLHVTYERKRLYEEVSDSLARGELSRQELLRRVEGSQD